jgi:TfoX/Sxy family transcriptional regulator of competence genes
MPYSEDLADRVRILLSTTRKVEEKKMMGGLTFMVDDKMCVGILGDDLMARIDPEIYHACLERQGCREMNFTGKPMKGFVFVDETGTHRNKDLQYWVDLALDYNKKAKASKKKAGRSDS